MKMIDNGFLNAFNVTRSGGDAPLFDQMFSGINFPGIGIAGQGGLTGSSALRRYTNTRALLANGSAGGVASFLNSTTNITGQGGGLFRGREPENFFVFNPQFAGAGINSNATSSTYHSLEVQVTKRLSHGFTNQTTYTWSKSLGISGNNDLVSTRDPNNRNLDHAPLVTTVRMCFPAAEHIVCLSARMALCSGAARTGFSVSSNNGSLVA